MHLFRIIFFGNMKGQIILIFLFAVSVIATGKKENAKENHRLHERSHRSGHEEKKSSQIWNPHEKSHARTHSIQFAYRVGNQHCEIVCNEGGGSTNGSDVEVKYNGNRGIVACLNRSAHVVTIYNYLTNIGIIVNGELVHAIVIDGNKQKYYYVEKNTHTKVILWDASKESFDSFYNKRYSLEYYLKISQQYGKAIKTSQELIKLIASDLKSLGIEYSANDSDLSRQIGNDFRGPLRFLFKGEGSFTVHNINWFQRLNLVLADLFRNNTKELQSLGTRLNLSDVYGSGSSTQAFLSLLSQIGNRVDLTKIFRDQLNSPQRFLDLLGRLNGGSNEGVDRTITLIVTVIRAINGEVSVGDVFTAIFNYYHNMGSQSANFSQVINQAIDLIESQNRSFHNSAGFQQITPILKALRNQQCVYRNINISEIIKALNSRNPVTIIQTFIRIFSGFLRPQQFSQVIRSFIENLNGTNVSNFFSRYFPGADFSNIRNIINNGSFLQTLRDFNFTSLANNSSALYQIPVIGQIFKQISSSFGSGFQVPFFNPNNISGSIQNAIANGPAGNFLGGFANIPSSFAHAAQNFAEGIIGSGNNSTPSSSPPESTTATSATTDDGTDKTSSESDSSESASTESSPSTDTAEDRHGHVSSQNENKIQVKAHGHLRGSSRNENVHGRHNPQEKANNYHRDLKEKKRYDHNNHHQ